MDKRNYAKYLESDAWKELRDRVLRAAGFRCRLCNRPHRTLQLHHRTYVRVGHEHDDDLTVLCPSCHEAYHKTRGGVDKGSPEASVPFDRIAKAQAARDRAAAVETRKALVDVRGESSAPSVEDLVRSTVRVRAGQRTEKEKATVAAQRHADRRTRQAEAKP